jgi:hypothetical protein
MQFFATLYAIQERIAIFNGAKPLKMNESKNHFFPIP